LNKQLKRVTFDEDAVNAEAQGERAADLPPSPTSSAAHDETGPTPASAGVEPASDAEQSQA
jgi:hypothetical protein